MPVEAMAVLRVIMATTDRTNRVGVGCRRGVIGRIIRGLMRATARKNGNADDGADTDANKCKCFKWVTHG